MTVEHTLAPYLTWAKNRPVPTFDLAGSNVLACSIDDLDGARDALDFSGRNDDGYPPLVEAIARQYGVTHANVATAQGASGANFQVCAALLSPGDDVIVERPGYDPLVGAPRLLGGRVIRFDRDPGAGYALDPDRIRAVMTPRTKLIVITSPHNPSGAVAAPDALEEVGRIAAAAGAHVLVDEVYLDAAGAPVKPAALFGDVFLSSSSLTKSYGLASLRCGWVLASPGVAERVRRARDVIEGTGSVVAERLARLAFAQIDRLHSRAVSLIATNRAIAKDFLNQRSDLDWFDPPGGTVVFPRIRSIEDTTGFADRLLAERDTAVVPGRFFDAPSHFRLGFGGSTGSLTAGLARLGEALDARAW